MSADLKTEFKGRLLAVKDLPTMPTVLDEVSRLMNDPNSSTAQIAKLISYDQVLSAKVLKMVNSPIYGFPGRISSIQHALVLLGFNVIRGVIISTSVFDAMNRTTVGLWEHSVGCSMACAEIARVAGFKEPEEYSVPGLLHDLGKVVAAEQLPEMKKDIDILIKTEDVTYYEAESRLLGFAHDRINAWLCEQWHLPEKIREGMVYHHGPLSAQHYPQVACVVHLADFLIKLYEYGSSGDDCVPYLEPKALEILGLKTKNLDAIVDNLGDRLMEVAGMTIS